MELHVSHWVTRWNTHLGLEFSYGLPKQPIVLFYCRVEPRYEAIDRWESFYKEIISYKVYPCSQYPCKLEEGLFSITLSDSGAYLEQKKTLTNKRACIVVTKEQLVKVIEESIKLLNIVIPSCIDSF